MASGTQVNCGISGEQFLSPNLSSDQKETMDIIVTEWIVNEDQCFNTASKSGFRAMMSTANLRPSSEGADLPRCVPGREARDARVVRS
jgi:hypothetical protein